MQSEPPDLRPFGIEVAARRRAKRWSIDMLAEKSGLSRKTIMNIESAKKGTRLSTVVQIAAALEVPVSDLVSVLNTTQAGPDDLPN